MATSTQPTALADRSAQRAVGVLTVAAEPTANARQRPTHDQPRRTCSAGGAREGRAGSGRTSQA
eukprot:11084744-Alexandrium_andersonii.AAC.1